MINNTKSIFDQFTRMYQLSKTLRFELKPIGKTADFLKQNKVFETDKLVDDNYHKIKYYFDALHREFIDEALRKVSFPVTEYRGYVKAFERFKKAKNKKKERNNFQKIEAELRRAIVKQFDETAKNWRSGFVAKGIELKQDGVEILFEEGILAALKTKFLNSPSDDLDAPAIVFTDLGTGEKKNLFDSFKGFFTYFSNFNNTKRNLYSEKEQDTAVANRAINENLRKFIENVFQFNENKDNYFQCGLTKQEQRAFELEFYNQCLMQGGIDNYNRIIGGFIAKMGEKIKGINEKINLYNQQNKDKKLRPFALLLKQILSKKDKKECFAEITDDSKVFATLKNFVALNDSKLKEAKKLMDSFFQNGEKYDLEKIYTKGGALNTISQKWFSNWSVISGLLLADSKKKSKKSSEENGETIKLPDFISIVRLKQALKSRSIIDTEEFIEAKDLFRDKYEHIYDDAKNHFETFMKIWRQEWQDCIEKNEKEEKGYNAAKQDVEKMMQKEKHYKKDNEQQIKKIKTYCDATLAVFQMMKYFALEKGRKKIEPDNGVDNEFYNPFNVYYQDYPVPMYYNEFRNYLTKKAHLGRLLFPSLSGKPEQRHPLSKRQLEGAEKIKLNFENGSLLGGWADSPEGNTQFCGHIFRKNGKYFLGISSDPKILDPKRNKTIYRVVNTDDVYEKMIYKQIKSTSIYGSCYIGKYKTKYADDKDKLNEVELVERIKSILQEKYLIDYPQLQEIINRNYTIAKDLAKDLGSLNLYSLKFMKINAKLLENLSNGESKEKFYLFELHNKDWNLKDGKKKTGTKNLHTLYFNALFDAKNLGNPILKLSGGAEVFFRPKNDNLSNKKDKKGKDVTDHKRYGDDKIFLHIPIVLNMGAGNSYGFNSQTNALIAKDKKERKLKIIGIDRGEKNLAYFALIDQNGKLLNCGDLNGNLPNRETYLKKLEDKAKRREEERKNWKTIENIKELKNGYISWVVRKFADMMIDKNAVLVFEDLNIGFKRSRQKMEQQVYQKLELALVQKLNYLVKKNAPEGVTGHYLKAYQLTPPVSTPKNIGKQCGAVFYVSPGYTSLTCPECGYRKNISFSFENILKAREFIGRINLSIVYKNGVFSVLYKTLDEKGNPKNEYKVSSNVERVRWHKKGTKYAEANPTSQGEKIIKNSKSGVVKEYNMTAVFKQLFDKNKIEYAKQGLFAKELSVPESVDYYRRLFWSLSLLLYSRNSVSSIDEDGVSYAVDYIQCPRCLFHSNNGFQGHKYNGDANGAYNIARKGLLALRKIQNAPDPETVRWGDLSISIEEWDKFAQDQWNQQSKSQK